MSLICSSTRSFKSRKTTTPLRQLYFVLQTMIIDPNGVAAARDLFIGMTKWMGETYENKVILSGLEAIKAHVQAEKPFEGIKLLRALLPIEDEILGISRANGRHPSRGCVMATVSPTTSSTSTSQSSTSTPKSTTSTSNTSSSSSQTSSTSTGTIDYSSFLKLLTAQLKYQDPTKPQDPSAFVAQLASFSQVEQGIKTNSKLDSLMTSMALTQASNMIGRTVTSSDGTVTGKVKSVNIVTGGAEVVLENGKTLSLDAGVRVSLMNPADALDITQSAIWTIIIASSPA